MARRIAQPSVTVTRRRTCGVKTVTPHVAVLVGSDLVASVKPVEAEPGEVDEVRNIVRAAWRHTGLRGSGPIDHSEQIDGGYESR